MERMQDTSNQTPRLADSTSALAATIVQLISTRLAEATSELEQRLARKAMDPVLTKEQAAEHLQVTVRTIDAWMKRGLIPYLKIGRTVRIRAREVDAMLSQRCEVNRRLRCR